MMLFITEFSDGSKIEVGNQILVLGSLIKTRERPPPSIIFDLNESPKLIKQNVIFFNWSQRVPARNNDRGCNIPS